MATGRSRRWYFLAAAGIALTGLAVASIARADPGPERGVRSGPRVSTTFFSAPLPLPDDIGVAEPPADTPAPPFTADQAINQITTWATGNGQLYSVDLALISSPGNTVDGAPFVSHLAWLAVVTNRTEHPISINPVPQIRCRAATGAKTSTACPALPDYQIHGNRFYVLDTDTGRLLISEGLLPEPPTPHSALIQSK